MRFEHFALNVADPPAMAAWYCEHLGFKIVRQSGSASRTHFLADATGRTVVELYCNAAEPVPDYAAQHPLRFHFALEVEDPEGLKQKLLGAGATFFEELKPDAVTHLAMLRDPWGVALQLCRRAEPMP
jgi:catechol 2,3-dioxygenase-like lactoylglutathione lyase family enzyme